MNMKGVPKENFPKIKNEIWEIEKKMSELRFLFQKTTKVDPAAWSHSFPMACYIL